MLLYYITDRHGFGNIDTLQRTALLRRIADAARGGVDYIQLREKDLPACELERLAREVVRAVRDNSNATKVLINSRSDMALAVGADGVHLPAGELAASDVRRLWMRCCETRPLIGVSVHAPADIHSAEEQGADFAVLAPIFEKVQAGIQGIGVETLRVACAGLEADGNKKVHGHFLILALGGVTVSNAESCIDAGAGGVAGIRLFQQGNVFETVRQLREL